MGPFFPKKGKLKFPITSVGRDVCDLLDSKENTILDTIEYEKGNNIILF
jgi:hypothetical protein